MPAAAAGMGANLAIVKCLNATKVFGLNAA
jgi:hypothetical protein